MSFVQKLSIFATLTILCLSGFSAAAGKESDLPLPRFVSLRAGEVNMRTGPGLRYPIDWIYRRKGLPVEIVAEYGTWRKIRDWQGIQGWVHRSLLTNKRMAIVTEKKRILRIKPQTASDAVARLESGVLCRILKCPNDSNWCRVKVNRYRGWLKKTDFWGIYFQEVFE